MFFLDQTDFIRKQYLPINWFSKNGEKLTDDAHPHIEVTDLDIYCQIEVNRAGTFHFYFTYNNTADTAEHQGALYAQVEPKLQVGSAKAPKDLPLDAIRCQTVLTKCLGPLSTWEKKLLVAKNTGYSMLHFTPIQVRSAEIAACVQGN